MLPTVYRPAYAGRTIAPETGLACPVWLNPTTDRDVPYVYLMVLPGVRLDRIPHGIELTCKVLPHRQPFRVERYNGVAFCYRFGQPLGYFGASLAGHVPTLTVDLVLAGAPPVSTNVYRPLTLTPTFPRHRQPP